MKNRITVPQVAKSMGVELSNKAAWSIGSEMASAYTKQLGIQPPKDNRPKTNGHGSHCFALYPMSWEPLIRKAIQEHQDAAKTQTTLFEES